MLLLRSLSAASRAAGSATAVVARTASRAASSLVVVERPEEKIAVIKMNRPPVNSLDRTLLQALHDGIAEVESDKSVEAAVLASTGKGIFSAGLDLMEMYQPKSDTQLADFWNTLQTTWLKLYTSRLGFVAAINGHAPAGGCLLAAACDHRVMAKGPFGIGLNEAKFGLVAPFWFADSLERVVGPRQAERLLQLGELVNPERALAIGLVDEVVEGGVVMTHALEAARSFTTVVGPARSASKLLLRSRVAQRLVDSRSEDTARFCKFASQPQLQKALGAYLASLKKPKKE